MSVDWTKPIQTAGGCRARLLGELRAKSPHIVVAVENTLMGDDEYIVRCRDDGTGGNATIINVPERLTLHEYEFHGVDTCNTEWSLINTESLWFDGNRHFRTGRTITGEVKG